MMYKLRIRKGFATVLKDGKEIETLTGIYIHDKQDSDELTELVELANETLKQKYPAPAPTGQEQEG